MRRSVIDPGGSQRAVTLYEADDFAAMRRAGQLAAATLDHVTPLICANASTGSLDRAIDAFMRAHGGTAATLGYRGSQNAAPYPASCCISVNHVVNHGIPSDGKLLRPGDTLNIDVTVILDGWYGDSSRMFAVGPYEALPVKARLLLERTYEAMWAGIQAVRPGVTLGEVGGAIQAVAEDRRGGVGFSVVRDFVGHGVGRAFHEAPEVRHYRELEPVDKAQPNGAKRPVPTLRLQPGMIFTIEPMVNAGRAEVKILADGWTTVTRDRSFSAQFEHTVGVTPDGVEVFTRSPAGYDRPPYALPG